MNNGNASNRIRPTKASPEQGRPSGARGSRDNAPHRSFKQVLHDAFIHDPDTVLRFKFPFDRTFFVLVILLLCFGSVMVFSAGYVYAKFTLNDTYYFVRKQLQFAIVGVCIMLVVTRIDYKIYKGLAVPAFGASFLLLALVLVMGFSSHGATRWIIVGPIRVQPSEIMKFALVLLLSAYISQFSKYMKTFKFGILYPGLIIGAVCGTTILEPHLSATIILFCIGAFMIFAGGARLKYLGILGGAAIALAAVFAIFTDYAKKRIDAWLHPENYLLTSGWQPVQSLRAIGSGGFFGVGIGNSYQKHLWLPEPQNDCIFSVVCEELGFVGAIVVILLFMLLIWRGFIIAMRTPDTFSSMLVLGIITKIAVQVILNIAVVTASIPTTGISLPFFSYGGSALVMLLGEMGIILAVSRYSSNDKI